MAATMTTPLEPGERPPTAPADGRPQLGNDAAEPGTRRRVTLDRAPGERYQPAHSTRAASDEVFGGIRGPVTIVAGLLGWLTGLLIRPPWRAATVATGVVVAGLLGIWLFGRWEGGVLNPIDYLAEVHGIAAPLDILAAAGMAAAASR